MPISRVASATADVAGSREGRRPARVTASPDVVADPRHDLRLGRRDQRGGIAGAVVRRGDPDVDRVGPRVGRDRGLRAAIEERTRVGPRSPTPRARESGASPTQLPLPETALARRGMTQSRHIGRISRGGPGSATTIRPSGPSTHQPGAVPLSFGMAMADGISHACCGWSPQTGGSAGRRASRSHVSRPASTWGVSPTAAAIDSRVRSSGVGPRPPVEMTRSTSASAPANARLTGTGRRAGR